MEDEDIKGAKQELGSQGERLANSALLALRSDDFHRTMRVGRYDRGNTAEQDSLQSVQPSRSDEYTVGSPFFGFREQHLAGLAGEHLRSRQQARFC